MERSEGGPAGGGRGALRGVRVLDLTRLAPGPYCTMLLADMGAEVIVVGGGAGSAPIPPLSRGKRFITLDLKSGEGAEVFRRLAERADVVIEGYRPGVMERLGLGLPALRALNPRLVTCAVTGYGPSGPLSREAGHDINYLALSGVLGALGPAGGVPQAPLNLLADFAGGSLFAVIGILAALHARGATGRGQHVEAAMVDGCLSLMAMHLPDWGAPVLAGRGDGLLAGSAPFYRCYACADGRFLAVGALERRFFEALWSGLGYPDPAPPDHMDRALWPGLTRRFEASFGARPRDAWCEAFAGRDACVTPVLDPLEALDHPHNRARHPDLAPGRVPAAPAMQDGGAPGEVDLTDRTREVLESLGLWSEALEPAVAAGRRAGADGLRWPPM